MSNTKSVSQSSKGVDKPQQLNVVVFGKIDIKNIEQMLFGNSKGKEVELYMPDCLHDKATGEVQMRLLPIRGTVVGFVKQDENVSKIKIKDNNSNWVIAYNFDHNFGYLLKRVYV